MLVFQAAFMKPEILDMSLIDNINGQTSNFMLLKNERNRVYPPTITHSLI